MRAAMAPSYGPPEIISVEERPTPVAGQGEVVAKVAAAGVNYADVLMVAGKYQVKPPPPFTPGLEFSGTIVEVGPGVDRWRIGDRVMGAPNAGGCFADYVQLSAGQVFAAPAGLSFELAAGFLIGHGTAGFALQRGQLKAGETVLITGAGGGVGIAAVGIAKRMGARVIAAAGSAEKLSAATAQGADETIDYRTQDLRAELKALTGGRGADVVLDTVGGEVFDAALKGLARWGRMLAVGFAGGTIPRVPAEYLLIKNISVLGVGFGGVIIEDPALAQSVIDQVLALHEAEPFKAEIAGRYSLEESPLALRRLLDRAVIGKLIITPDPSLLPG
jgi:NADPH2:quinone reductase